MIKTYLAAVHHAQIMRGLPKLVRGLDFLGSAYCSQAYGVTGRNRVSPTPPIFYWESTRTGPWLFDPQSLIL